jgi:hypothetical protein
MPVDDEADAAVLHEAQRLFDPVAVDEGAIEPAEFLGEVARHLRRDVDRRVLEQAQANVDVTGGLADGISIWP